MGEVSVQPITRARIPTAEGEFQLCLYKNGQAEKEHLALVLGDVAGRPDVLVRVHSECFTGDVLGSLRCDCGSQLNRSMQWIAQEGVGIIVYLRQEGRGIGLSDKLRAYNLQDQGYDTVDANLLLGHQADERDYTVAAMILKDLAVPSVRLLTNNPLKIESLQEHGVPVTARVPLPAQVTAENAEYLQTKVQRMHHLLSLDSIASAAPKHANGSPAEPVRAPTPVAQYDTHRRALLARMDGHRQRTGRPFVTLSYAQSVDGCIAARPGQPMTLSGPQSLVLTHQLRADHEAILVGIGTVLADNPSLTVRLVNGRNPQPIIADSRLRFPSDAKLLQNPDRTAWIATSQQADGHRQEVLETAGARVLWLPPNARGQVDLAALLERLGQLGINSLMVEGGTRIITSFLSERLVDSVVLTIAPKLLGGLRAVRKLRLLDSIHLPRLHNVRYQQLEDDIIMWGDPVWEAQEDWAAQEQL